MSCRLFSFYLFSVESAVCGERLCTCYLLPHLVLMSWIGELAGNLSLQFIHIIRFGTLLLSLFYMKRGVPGTCNVFDHYNTTGFFLFVVI